MREIPGASQALIFDLTFRPLETVAKAIDAIPGFPPQLKTVVQHLLISHHGEYEFGSPKLPMFPEALMLHYLDDLDSKMHSMYSHFNRESASDSAWTSYNPSLGRPLLNTEKFLPRPQNANSEASKESEPQPSGPANLSVLESVTLPETLLTQQADVASAQKLTSDIAIRSAPTRKDE